MGAGSIALTGMVSRFKPPRITNHKAHYEDDELRAFVLAYLQGLGLPEDHPAMEAYRNERPTLEIVRAFPDIADENAAWDAIKPEYEAWDKRFRAGMTRMHSSGDHYKD